jgi:hypothetical protein
MDIARWPFEAVPSSRRNAKGAVHSGTRYHLRNWLPANRHGSADGFIIVCSDTTESHLGMGVRDLARRQR